VAPAARHGIRDRRRSPRGSGDAGQLAGNQRGIDESAYAHGHVVTGIDQVRRCIRQRGIEADIGIGGEEVLHVRHDVPPAKRGRDIDPEEALRTRVQGCRRATRLLQLGENLRRMFVKQPPRLGQMQAPRRTVQQRGPKILFQPADVTRHS
jgi:hypothetical protein